MKRFLICAFLLVCSPLAANAQVSSNAGSLSGATAGSNIYQNFQGNQSAPSPTAPPFVTASPCMGTISGAGTSPFIGIALGMSYKDKECELRNNASSLNSMGDRAAALQLLCQIDSVKTAMAAAGTPCDRVNIAYAPPPAYSPIGVEHAPAPVPASDSTQGSTIQEDPRCVGLTNSAQDQPYVAYYHCKPSAEQ